MILREVAKQFFEKEQQIKVRIAEKHIDSYEELVQTLIEELVRDDKKLGFDPKRIKVVDFGEYQGTLVFVIGGTGYQPSDHWYVKVGYGSCSGCDTLQSIHDYSQLNKPPTPKQIKDYWTLMLHVVQGIRKMEDE